MDLFKSSIRLLLRTALAALLSLPLLTSAVRADNPANDSDAITITLRPTVDIGVDIDTSSVNLDFTLAMGATDYTLNPIGVTILGNIQPQELDLSAHNVSDSPVWTLDTDEVAASDELQLYALFSVSRATNPLEVEFDGVKNLLTGSPKRAGQSPGLTANGNFENNVMEGGVDADNILLSAPARQLWLRMDVPPLTSTADLQKIQVTVTATRTSL